MYDKLHDNLTKTAYYEAGFETVSKSPMIVDGDFILSHQPIQGDLGKFFNIHGHIHRLPTEEQISPRHYDIGVDGHNFFPHDIEKVEKCLYRGTRQSARQKKVQKSYREKFVAFFRKRLHRR